MGIRLKDNKKLIRMRVLVFSIVSIFFITAFCIIPKNNASAISGYASSITEKAKRKGAEKCFGYGLNSEIDSVYNYLGADSVFPKSGEWTSNESVKMPYKYGNNINNGYISCRDLIVNDLFRGKIPIKLTTQSQPGSRIPISTSEDAQKIDQFLTAVGYTSSDVNEGTSFECYSMKFKLIPENAGVATEHESGQICFRVDANGKLTSKGDKYDVNVDATWTTDNEYFDFRVIAGRNKIDQIQIVFNKVTYTSTYPNFAPVAGQFNVDGTTSIQTIKEKIDATLKNNAFPGTGMWMRQNDYSSIEFVNSSLATEDTDIVVVDKKYSYGGTNIGTALEFATGNGSVEDYTFQEHHWMYYDILADSSYFNALVVDGTCGDTQPSGYYLQYYDKNNDKLSYCPLSSSRVEAADNFTMNGHSRSGIYGISANRQTISRLGVDKVLEGLNTINLRQYCGEDPNFPLCKGNPVDNPITTTDPVDVQDAGQVKDEECYKHAKSLGWIICPIINGMHEVVSNIYDQVEPLIAVNGNIIDDIGDENGGAYWAWITFRNLANIAFIVFFMIVIFSQLTGYGIDNYGIKKLLPKLIVTAILVNLSYFIISILIDLSNIIGSGIQGLFERIPIVASDGGSGNIGTGFKAVTGIIVSWIGIGAAGAAAVTFGGWALIIPILLYLLSAAVSIIFGFIVLGLRQAVIIILIVISPIAIVLMALPNTEKLFKKYTDLLKGVLVVYPVIGTLIGAGNFASKLLMRGTEHGFIMTLIAGLLCVIPYLLIPSLTRKSLDAMGNIGARLGQMGQNLGRGLSRGVGNLEPVKNLNEDWKERQSARNANRWLQTKRGIEAAAAVKEGRANPRQAKQYKRYVTAAGADKAASIAARGAQASFDRLSSDAGYAAALAGINKKENEQLIKDQDALFEDQGVYNNLNTFQNEIEKAFANDDTIALEALMKKATDGSDAQRERLSRALDNSLRSGAIGTKAATAYASHINTNGVYKGKNRSQDYQASAIMRKINDGSFAKDIKNASKREELTRTNYVKEAFNSGKYSPESIFNMEDGEFNAINNGIKGLTGNDKAKMVSTLQKALDEYNNDTTGTYKKTVKDETIKNIKETLENLRSVDISHDSSTPTTDEYGGPTYDDLGRFGDGA